MQPYRIKIENGKITVSAFDKGNPIPFVHFKGSLYSEKTRQNLIEIKHKLGDRNAVRIIEDFIKMGEWFSKKNKKDFEIGNKQTRIL